MSDLAQQIIVGLAAAGAAAYLLRGIVSAFRPQPRPPSCEHCAVADLADQTAATTRRTAPEGQRG